MRTEGHDTLFGYMEAPKRLVLSPCEVQQYVR
jgi:hypothetical protein